MKKILPLGIALILIFCSACSSSATLPQSETPESSIMEPESGGSQSENLNSNQVLYDGYPVDQFYGCATIDDIAKILGSPLNEEHYMRSSNYIYDDIYFMFDDDIGGLYIIYCKNPGEFEINGSRLNTNKAGLIEIFGNPTQEGWHEWDGSYELVYRLEDYDLIFSFISPEGKVNNFSFRVISEYDFDEEDTNGDFDQDYYDDSGFPRSMYFTGITGMDLLRYPDNNMYNNVYFSRYTVAEVMEPRLYFVQDSSINMAANVDHLIIDDRNGNGANAVAGDVVAVYGTFHGNTTINFTDGSSKQVSHIVADRFIINNFPPDAEDLAQGIVDLFNHKEYSFGHESRYISSNTIQLVLGVLGTGEAKHVVLWDESKMGGKVFPDPRTIGDVDGYGVSVSVTLADGLTEPKDLGIGNGDYLDTFPVRVNCTITAVEQGFVVPSLIVGLRIDGFEPY